MQISDLHFAPGPVAERGLADATQLIQNLAPDLIVVSGDLTRDGLLEHFLPVIEFLQAVGIERVRAIPGNRDYLGGGPGPMAPGDSDFDYFLVAPDTPDARQSSDGRGSRELSTPFTDFFDDIHFYERQKEMTIVGLDSEPTIPDETLQLGLDFLHSSAPKATRVFCTHRSLLPVPRKKLKPGDLLPNAGDVLAQLIDARVDLVLCAHLHRVHVWQLGDGEHSTVVVNAPSLLDTSPGKENGLLTIDIPRRGEICVTLHALNGQDERVLFDTRSSPKRRKRVA